MRLRSSSPAKSQVVFVGILLLLLSASPAHGQDGEVLLRGFVRAQASGQALQGANVVLRTMDDNIEEAVVTDRNGFYQMAQLSPGQYRLRISYVGYHPHEDTLQLEEGANRTISVTLRSAPQELEEVTIEGREPVDKAEAGLRRIRAADIETIPAPGPGNDLASYLRSLPGVTTTGDRGGRLYIRGGTPSQNFVLVDGTPIYKPFHIIGLYSAFPSELVSSTEFYAGGFGAEYTGRMSSVLDIQLRPGNVREYEGSVGVGPFLASARFEGPITRNELSFLVNARHSLIEHSGPTLLGEDAPYKFYDFTAKVHTQGESSQCSLTGLRTYDRGRIDPNSAASFRWNNTTVGGECLFFTGEASQVVTTTAGVTHFNNVVNSADGTQRSAGRMQVHTKIHLEQPAPWNGTLEGSARIKADQYNSSFEEPFLGISKIDASSRFLITGILHLGTQWNWGEEVSLEPSIGSQLPFSNAQGITLEPRLRFSYQPSGFDDMKLTAATGLYRQLETGLTDERDAGSTFQALTPTPFEANPLQSVHALLGWNQRLSSAVHFSAEGWFKTFSNLPVPRWTPIVRFNTNLARADGHAYGADFTFQYQQDPIRVDVTYGYGQVQYEAAEDAIGAWLDEPIVEYSPPHDLRHKVGVTSKLDLDLVTASVRWQFSSGLPFTPVYGYDTMLEIRGFRDPPFEDLGTPRALFRKAYSDRLPSYHRLDLSLQRTFTLTSAIDAQVETGAINTYDRANVFYIDIFTLDRVDQLPLLPYLSLTVNFND